MIKTAIYCVTYKSYEVAEMYLKSLDIKYDSATNVTLSVFIADNTDTNFKNISYQPSNYRLKVFNIHKNLGYFGAIQYMMQKDSPLQFDYSIISNVDLSIAPTFFHTLSCMKINNNVGWIAPQIYSKMEQRDRNPKIINRYPLKKLKVLKLFFKYPILYNLYTHTIYKSKKLTKHENMDIYAGHGSFIILTKEYFKRCGIIEYPIFLFCEEIYLGEQCLNNNLRVIYDQSLVVYDSEHVSTSNFKNSKYCNLNYLALDYIIRHYYK